MVFGLRTARGKIIVKQVYSIQTVCNTPQQRSIK